MLLMMMRTIIIIIIIIINTQILLLKNSIHKICPIVKNIEFQNKNKSEIERKNKELKESG